MGTSKGTAKMTKTYVKLQLLLARNGGEGAEELAAAMGEVQENTDESLQGLAEEFMRQVLNEHPYLLLLPTIGKVEVISMELSPEEAAEEFLRLSTLQAQAKARAEARAEAAPPIDTIIH